MTPYATNSNSYTDDIIITDGILWHTAGQRIWISDWNGVRFALVVAQLVEH
jgi:sugar lactone lactonase YvrE